MSPLDVATKLGHQNLNQIYKVYGASMRQQRALAASRQHQVGADLGNGKAK
jgi:hypothetical protein